MCPSTESGTARQRHRHVAPVVAGLTLSWLGQYLHNQRELDLPLWRPENSLTATAAATIALIWWRHPGTISVALLAGWTALQLGVGAILSALPIGLFPFDPEQTLTHHTTHALYGALQLPLLWATLRARHENTPAPRRPAPSPDCPGHSITTMRTTPK